jgi:N-acetylneuraminate lyase
MILEKWVEVEKGKFKVFAHVGSNSQREAVILSEHASRVGADGIAAVSPNFFKPWSVADLVNFFEQIAEVAKDMPSYYPKIPFFCNHNYSSLPAVIPQASLLPVHLSIPLAFA